MPWIDENMHVTLSPAAKEMTETEIRAAAEEWRIAAILHREQSEKARAALGGLPYAAVPLDQLADIYKRFLRLIRLGQHTFAEWDEMSEGERELRSKVFNQADFGAVYAGQWLPRDLRNKISDLVRGKRYDYQFDQHEVAYHRARLDGLIFHANDQKR